MQFNDETRKIILEALNKIEFPQEQMNQIPLAIRAFLHGKSPVEFLAGLIVSMPDSVVEQVIAVAQTIAEATK